MRATQDFNYKVALASGLKSLQAGRLRQAEEQFRYLVEKFPGLPGGHRGLAKVLVELEDRSAAFAILRDGGSGLAKAGDREGAITLFREAVSMDPRDTTTHRRLAAALAISGDLDGAVTEVERYVEAQSGPGGDAERARLAVAYAFETLGEHRRLASLAERFGMSGRAIERVAPAEASGGIAQYSYSFPDPAATPAAAPVPQRLPAIHVTAAAPAPAAEVSAVAPAFIAPAEAAADMDSDELEQRAAELIARRDPQALPVALAAATRHFAEGRTDAASDLLLQLISSGIGGHDAQRALVDVVQSSRPDIAREKSALLAEVLRLAGPG